MARADDAAQRTPPPLRGPRDAGDAWVESPTGERYWGRFGAAGLMACDPDRGVLLQHRATWSHHGDTWGLPGGALREHESPIAGALREAAEEAGVPATAVIPRATWVVDKGVWCYTTVIAHVETPFEAFAADAESHALAWVPPDAVDDLPLHPGFAAAWPALAPLLETRLALVVDAANVVGAVPDGWWRDRAAAAQRLGHRIAPLATRGISGHHCGLGDATWLPRIEVVLEGAASSATLPEAVTSVVAPGEGDDAIVAQALALGTAGWHVVAVTSDRQLRTRLENAGARVEGARWLLDLTASS